MDIEFEKDYRDERRRNKRYRHVEEFSVGWWVMIIVFGLIALGVLVGCVVAMISDYNCFRWLCNRIKRKIERWR